MENIPNIHTMTVGAWITYFTKHYPATFNPADFKKMFSNVKNAHIAANVLANGRAVQVKFLNEQGEPECTLCYASLDAAIEAGRNWIGNGFVLKKIPQYGTINEQARPQLTPTASSCSCKEAGESQAQ